MTATHGYTAISRRTLDLEDYVDVARRHAVWIAGPLYAGIVLSVCVAFSLRNIYESQAMMQITPTQISADLVPSTITQQLNERVAQMQSTILSRTNLSNLIQDPHLKLYPDEMASRPVEDVIEMMRRDITISIGNNAADRKGASTFAIKFSYNNRLKAQETVQALVTKFIDENETSQRRQQNILKDFFGDELNQAKADMEKKSADLTRFRGENQGRLPEQSQLNMSYLASLQAQVNGINDQLNRLQQDRGTQETHLSSLKAQLDMNNMIGQEPQNLSAFSPAARQNEELVTLNKSIAEGESRLRLLLKQYKDTYPDIRDLRSSLADLKAQRDELLANQEKQQAEEAAKKEGPKRTTNYQLLQAQTNIQAQIDATNQNIKNIDAERQSKLREQARLNEEIVAYRNKLAATSNIEAQYADLNRDYNNAAQRYQETFRKKELTAQSSNLIQRDATEKLTVLDPPSLPSKPSKPNRWQIVGIGIGVSLMLGIALAGVQEARDTSLKNLKDVRAYTNLPVLSSIPLLENTLLVKRKRRIAYLLWSAALIIGLAAVGAAVFYYEAVIANT